MKYTTDLDIHNGLPENIQNAMRKWHEALTATNDALEANEPGDETAELMNFALHTAGAVFVCCEIGTEDIFDVAQQFVDCLKHQIELRDGIDAESDDNSEGVLQ